MKRNTYQSSNPKSLWLSLVMLCLLLTYQWAAALSGNTLMQAGHASQATMHLPSADAAVQHDACQSGASLSLSDPHGPSCNHAVACSFCHASSAVQVAFQALVVPTVQYYPPWPASFYTSIIHANPDRPPAALLA